MEVLGCSYINAATGQVCLSIKLWESFVCVTFKIFSKSLRILTGKKHPKIKLQRLQKIQIWTFGLLVHQINSF